ncbi:hypothetical protein [Oryza sativa Japonica Group]|uniref:Uncharacterized protein n=1 Tax=Oryza sativa subsp. japonica TaxID=39947 RepID=Q5ZBN8_ORYSJ|nr:hypothetical protein [Oryza sativa Japonica Group]BAD53048.1 hypothetical protein [Oryza sativa Japonica Group]
MHGATWSSPAARPSPLSPAALRPRPDTVSTTPLSRVHSPTLYFDARLRFAYSPALLRCRAGPSQPSPVVGVDLDATSVKPGKNTAEGSPVNGL